MQRRYQYGFSAKGTAMFDMATRERKARTMVAVLEDFLGPTLRERSLLDIGGSTGIIDNYLAGEFGWVVGLDIDEPAIAYGRTSYRRGNLHFCVGDAINLPFDDGAFSVVICAQVYEHVPNAPKLMAEILRVLAPGGVCYFAATNRIMWNEPHYQLPLLSVVPRFLAHYYVRLMGRGRDYHELHHSYWGLRKLVRRFVVHDYTDKVVSDPKKYGVSYMVRPGTMKASIARIMARYVVWLVPGYIWLLEKPR